MEGPSTWKERVEAYKLAQKTWEKGRSESMETVQMVCRETSVPAMEAGLAAVCVLAEKNKLEGHGKDVTLAALKQITSTKPAMRAVLKRLFSALARHAPEKVAMHGAGQIKDKNPKVIVDTLKMFAEEAVHLEEQLLVHLLPHTLFLFAHGSGQVREEATKLFQVLAEKNSEQIEDAISSLKPIQIKDIMEGRKKEAAKEAAQEEERSTEEPGLSVRTESQSVHVPNSEQQEPLERDRVPQREKPAVPSQRSTPSHPKESKAGAPKQYKLIGLPSGFYNKFGSSVWKDRLVMEDLSDMLGMPQKCMLSKEESYSVISLILKKVVSEKNNKVFIASMSVLRKLACSQELVPQMVKEIVLGVGARLKDKNTQVNQSVVQVLVELFRRFRAVALGPIVGLLHTEKSARGKTLQALNEALEEAKKEDLEIKDLVPFLAECTKDASGETRALACTCVAQVLVQQQERLVQEEIEQLGIDRLLAQKIERLVDEQYMKKEAEVSEIVDSLCEDIRNTTITCSVPSPSVLMTPVKKPPVSGGERSRIQAQIKESDMEEIVNSPIIRNKVETQDIVALYAGEQPSMQSSVFQPVDPAFSFSGRKSGAEGGSYIMQFVETGVVERADLMRIIGALDKDSQVSGRAISVLQHAHITDVEAGAIREKLERTVPETPQIKVALEGLRMKIERILAEKSLFEERCLFVSLVERLGSGEPVQETEIISVLQAQAQRGNILQEDDARQIIRRLAEEGFQRAAECLDTVFPVSKTLQYCVAISEEVPGALGLVLPLMERVQTLPHASLGEYLRNTQFIALLEKERTLVASKILFLLRGESESVQPASPYVKKVRHYIPETVDVNSLLHDIIDQDAEKARRSLEVLDRVSADNMAVLVESSAALVNVLLLQLNDALSSGVSVHPNIETILRIIMRTCDSDRFLMSVNVSALQSLVSDYVMIVIGQLPKRSLASEQTRKECSKTLIKICTNGPCAALFKIYMGLLHGYQREEKAREVLIKLLWKHSKVAVGFLGDKKVVSSLINTLNTFYSEFRSSLRTDPLISKVLHMHLIEILKYYGRDIVTQFEIPENVRKQIEMLSSTKSSAA